MVDETYCKPDFKYLQCDRYYFGKDRKSASDDFNLIKIEKIKNKMFV